MFCPECGKALAATNADQPAGNNDSAGGGDAMPNAAGAFTAATLDAPRNLKAENVTPAAEPDAPPVTMAGSAKSAGAEKHGARQRTRETLHRASSVARGAIEDNVKRVEKIHHVSSVMFEEAHYDPSLRFVLVALGLFVVFIILLVLSKLMG